MGKKIPFYVLIICLCQCKNPPPVKSEFFSDYTSDVISIDGDLGEWTGENSNIITFGDRELNHGGMQRTYSDNTMEARSLWNLDYLYLSIRIKDKELRAVQIEKDHKQLYLDDMVEFLIDSNNDGSSSWLEDDIVYHINAAGVKKDDRGTPLGTSDSTWDGMAIYAVKINGSLNNGNDVDVGYDVEVAIPWNELGILPVAGTKIGFNIVNGDNDGKGRQLFDWVGAWPLRSPNLFGSLVLRKHIQLN